MYLFIAYTNSISKPINSNYVCLFIIVIVIFFLKKKKLKVFDDIGVFLVFMILMWTAVAFATISIQDYNVDHNFFGDIINTFFSIYRVCIGTFFILFKFYLNLLLIYDLICVIEFFLLILV